MRPAGAGAQAPPPPTPVPPQELVQPAAVHAVRSRELADRPTLAQVRLDQVPPDVHPETPSMSCLRCLDTSTANVSLMSSTHTPSGLHERGFVESYAKCGPTLSSPQSTTTGRVAALPDR